MTKAIYVSWIGTADLDAMTSKADGQGPVAQCLKQLENDPDEPKLDAAVLLHTSVAARNYSAESYSKYIKWIKEQCSVSIKEHSCDAQPANFEEVGKAALQALRKIKKKYAKHDVQFVFHTSPGTPAMSNSLILLGSTHFKGRLIHSDRERGYSEFTLPFKLRFSLMEDHALSSALQGLPSANEAFEKFTGNSKPMQDIKKLLSRVASSQLKDIAVLLTGEPGTGKELAAQTLHEASGRKGKFVAVNLGAVPSELFEAELFGYNEGSFTGARKGGKQGKLLQADKGTLFLDEVGELPLHQQAKLLRVLQERKVTPVGGIDEEEFDVQLVAATNRDLLAMVQQGTFREDLFYRLAVIPVHLPPLRDREDDVLFLIDEFFKQALSEEDHADLTLSESARQELAAHSWPGNIRELKSTIARIVLYTPESEQTVSMDVVKAAIFTIPESCIDIAKMKLGSGFSLDEVRLSVDKFFIEKALAKTGGVKKSAAKLLGCSEQTFENRYKKIRKRRESH